jgi:serine/threonine protein kinase
MDILCISKMELHRHNNGIKYITPLELDTLYPLEEKYFAKGSFGKLYKSHNNYAVKVFDTNSTLAELVIELNIHANIRHPNILHPLAWSVKNSKGYLVMDLGVDILTAFSNDEISYQKIIRHTLAAISFMNSNGFVNGDIKPDNMIYQGGKCMLIDMGLAQRAELNIDEDYYVTGDLYTSNYRDPEYYKNQYNSIKSEIYSLAASYKEIVTFTVPVFGDLYCYKTDLPLLEDFIVQAQKPIKDRLNINEIVRIMGCEYNEGSIFSEGEMSNNPDNYSICKSICNWIIEMCYEENTNMETVFLCLHLTRYCLDRIIKQYTNFRWRIFGYALLALVFIVKRETQVKINTWFVIDGSENGDLFEQQYQEMTLNILLITEGALDRITTWHYAKSKAHLKLLLADFYMPSYSSTLSRHITGSNNKSIRIRSLMSLREAQFYEKNYTDTSGVFYVGKIHPSHLYVGDNAIEIASVWNNKIRNNYNLDYNMGLLLRNRTILRKLPRVIALNIFFYLVQNSKNCLVNYILTVECHHNWFKLFNKVIKGKIHPFKIKNTFINLELLSSDSEENEDNVLTLKLSSLSFNDAYITGRKTSSPSPMSKSPKPLTLSDEKFSQDNARVYYESSSSEEEFPTPKIKNNLSPLRIFIPLPENKSIRQEKNN